ncbi:MAG: ABC transporter permease [Actinobacteria bacterium]|nr:ABC transporter permease [Actinomycetota bacterium]
MTGWTLSWNGLRTVVELELKQRVRSRRWIWALVGWFVVIGLISWLIVAATDQVRGGGASDYSAGAMAFGMITYFVLGMGLLIAPAFTATSINGDRSAGTLATLQATRLSALELATGKLVAAWLAAAVFLVVALPFIAWSMLLGNISFWQVLVTFAVVFAEVAVVCAIGLGWSALVSRPAGSTFLTYFSVVVLTAITVIVVGMLALLVTRPEPVRVWGLNPADDAAYQLEVERYWQEHPEGGDEPPPPVTKCTWYNDTESVSHLDQIWWILAANPFVVVADAAPLPPGSAANLSDYRQLNSDPLALLRWGVRRMAIPPALERDRCTPLYDSLPGYTVEWDSGGTPRVYTSGGTLVNVSPVQVQPVNVENPIWPWGLGANVLLGAVFFWVAVRRLSVPYGTLPSGTRVA